MSDRGSDPGRLPPRDRTPLMAALVYPPHVLFVPPRLFQANFFATALLYLLFGFEPLVLVIGLPAGHAVLAACYLREPYMEGLIQGWWAARHWPAWRRTTNRVPYDGNKYVA